MLLHFDTHAIADANLLGTLISGFLRTRLGGGHPYFGRPESVSGWTDFTGKTPRPLSVVLLGDEIYDPEVQPVHHIFHNDTGLQVLWSTDGDLHLMFHKPHEFTISNSHNGMGNHWRREDLIDPRNDPAYRPDGLG